jgi:hypothetical protein
MPYFRRIATMEGGWVCLQRSEPGCAVPGGMERWRSVTNLRKA